jgi:endothelin-converting enzyme/putative endopeptidase
MKRFRLSFAILMLSACAWAQTEKSAAPALQPLQELPYTPSLDVKSMDLTADPCVDFYQYTCGGWMKNNPIPADRASWSVYGKLARENEQYLWGILRELSQPTASRTPVQQKIGDMFASCMDEAEIERRGTEPLRAVLSEIDKVNSKKALASLLGRLHAGTAGGGMLFTFGSNQDYGDATQVIGFADAGGLGLPDRDYYTDTDAKSRQTRARYLQHVARILVLSGETQAQAAADARTVLRIETALAKASLTRVELRDPYNLYHKVAPGALQKMTPSFDWTAYWAALGAAAPKSVNVTQPKFFAKGVEVVLQREPLTALKVYLRWHAAASLAEYLDKRFDGEHFAFYSAYLRGIKEQQPRWERCVANVDSRLGEALGQEFVRRTFTDKTRNDTLQMTEGIERAMESEIRTLDWMSEETRQRAIVKLHAVRNKIGFPAKWRDYSAVEIRPGDYLGNIVRADAFETKRQLGKIGKPVDRDEWGMTPPTVNAYYNPQMNDINFPAGVLQPPLYDPKMDAAPNFGNTGGTIGHELTHAFDDEGRQFDGEGNLKDWWTKQDATAFEQKIGCIRAQYAQYTVVDDIKINSKLTSGEDVADIGGTLLAYIAWKAATEGQQLANAGGFTPEQRFFIGYSQWACENERPENLRVHAKTDPHSPGRYRVNGVVINIPAFQTAFGCKKGQPMYKDNLCRVW